LYNKNKLVQEKLEIKRKQLKSSQLLSKKSKTLQFKENLEQCKAMKKKKFKWKNPMRKKKV
jgi:hypothetical protein